MSDWIEGEMQTPERELLERDIQKACIEWARAKGAYCRKFSSPANRSVPDYLIVHEGEVWFVEFKRPGKQPTEKQTQEQEAVKAAGGEVWVIDNLEVFKDYWFQ